MKRKSNPQRFRKKQSNVIPDLDSRSSVLRGVRDLIQKGNYALALTQVDQQVARSTDVHDQARLLAFAGDCLSRQGKFSEAAAVFASVHQSSTSQPLMALRVAQGEISSLLKNVQVTEAQARALAAVQTALTHQQEYQTQLVVAQATIASGGQAVIPPQPPTPGETANRLAKLFFSEGEIAAAKALYQQALQLSPNSTHTRLGLAKIALRENAPVEASRLAREALVLGQCRARTLGAWPILLAASRMTGTPFDATLLPGLAQATPTVRARATFIIARGLRSQGDSRWEQIGNDWLQQSAATNPAMAAEFRKVKSAHRRAINAPSADQLQTAQNLLQITSLSPVEWLGAAKRVVKHQLLLNQTPDLTLLLNQAANRFGAGKKARFAHGLALACKKSARLDLAQQLWQQNVATADGEIKRKSIWALARSQGEQGNHTEAAASYWTYSQDSDSPRRFRLYALLEWTREIAAANQPELIAQARPQIEAVLPQINNYELVLDLSRQIRLSKLPRDFVTQVFQRGQQLALQAFDAAGHPAPAVTILFKLCRRANDHRQYDAMIATWTRLTETKRQWLWSESNDYWQWVELVFRAYRDNNQPQEANSFIAPLLNDPATPALGYATVGVSYAAMKRRQGDFVTMFSVYERMAQVAPTYEWTSAAHYWFALRAWKQGNPTLTATNADKMLLALGAHSTLRWKQEMAASAFLLKAGLDVSLVAPKSGISASMLQSQINKIQSDLTSLV